MQLTVFGFAVLAMGVILLLRASTLTLLMFVLGCSLMGGSAALFLTGLGNSSVPPTNLAMLFLAIRCMLPDVGQTRRLSESISANAWLLAFAFYGALSAWILPRVFAGALAVTPLRPNPGKYLMAVSPLQFSAQNITVSVYLLSTLLAGICAYIAVRSRRSAPHSIARAAAAIGSVHAILGFASVLFGGPLAPFFVFFRNGFYAQLNQSISGFVRMSGIWAEPAVFAAYGFIWLVFLTELWLRDVEPKWTGRALILILVALVVSTSSTAYIGLAGYAVILALRTVLNPKAIPARKMLGILLAAGLATAALLFAAATRPELLGDLSRIFSFTTVDKLDSESGIQRAFWARQGYDAFIRSFGLGIGAGSFRSSSLLTAILGSTGVIGAAAFVAQLIRVFEPLSRST
jgi:O-Antigen ligase